MLFSPKNKKIAAWKVVTALIDRKEHAPPFPHVQSYLWGEVAGAFEVALHVRERRCVFFSVYEGSDYLPGSNFFIFWGK